MSETPPPLYVRLLMVGDWQGAGFEVDESMDEVITKWRNSVVVDGSTPSPITLHVDGKRVLVNPQMIETVREHERELF